MAMKGKCLPCFTLYEFSKEKPLREVACIQCGMALSKTTSLDRTNYNVQKLVLEDNSNENH
jgi:heterodisulfide reductase subunit C